MENDQPYAKLTRSSGSWTAKTDSSQQASLSRSQVTIHVNCNTINNMWITNQQTRHLGSTTTQRRTKKIVLPVIAGKGVTSLAALENGVKELNSWLLPDPNGTLLLTKQIIKKMLHIVKSAPSSPQNIELHLFCKVVVVQDHFTHVNNVTDWVMQQSMQESAFSMVPASDSSIKSLTRTVIADCDDESCSVCFEEILTGSEVVCMPCSHVYHQDCIEQWLKTSHYCPNCRYEMPTK